MAAAGDNVNPVKTEAEARLQPDPNVPNPTEKTGATDTKERGGESLEDLCSILKQQIASSNWLQENTSEKWAKENPELAKEFMENSKTT